MRQEQAGADLAAETPEIGIRPRREDVAVEARLGPLPIPGDAEAVAVRRRLAFERVMALGNQRVARRRDDLLQEDGFAQIGRPAAHVTYPRTALLTVELRFCVRSASSRTMRLAVVSNRKGKKA